MTTPAATDYLDYIFRFPSQGAFQGDPFIQQYAPSVLNSQPGVQLLIYNPVETLSSRANGSNSLVQLPQQANSTVPLSGFWAMITLKGFPGPSALTAHPNLQILNDRTFMFARQPSVISSTIDVSHINIVINIFGVYVTDGLQLILSPALLLEDGTSDLLLEGGGNLLLEG